MNLNTWNQKSSWSIQMELLLLLQQLRLEIFTVYEHKGVVFMVFMVKL